MNRSTFLADDIIREFISWLEPRLCGPVPFKHSWISPRTGPCECSSLFDAYRQYSWRGRDFAQTSSLLDHYSIQARLALKNGNLVALQCVFYNMLKWGGVRVAPADMAVFCAELDSSLKVLDPDSSDLANLNKVMMNSAFTKLYHLLIDDFPIYDGRVGAALGLIVSEFLKDAGLNHVPGVLNFGWGPGRRRRQDNGPLRDPSRGGLKFLRITSQPRFHAQCNIKAAWLLGELAGRSCFDSLPQKQRVRALEAALFMIGYDLA